MKETVFYIVGIALAISAVIVSFIGLKSEKFPGKMSVVVILVFAAGAIGASTFAVLYSKEHEEHREHELEHANEVFESEEHGGPFEEGEEEAGAEGSEEEHGGSGAEEGGGGEASGGGGTLEVVANETNIAYEEKSLEAEAGEVEIDFDNPSAIEHDVKIEKDGEEIGGTDVIMDSEASATVELEPGEYTFFCSVPGHREAGMEGPLTVK